MAEAKTFPRIGARLRQAREAFSGLSQTEWAAQHGFAVTQWNNWETGARRIPVDCAETLCDRHGLTLDYIYRGRRDCLSAAAAAKL